MKIKKSNKDSRIYVIILRDAQYFMGQLSIFGIEISLEFGQISGTLQKKKKAKKYCLFFLHRLYTVKMEILRYLIDFVFNNNNLVSL